MADEKVTMTYVLGERDFIEVLNRSRRVGTDTRADKKTETDKRPQVRINYRIMRAAPLAENLIGNAVQKWHDLMAAKYGIGVIPATSFSIYSGKTEAELTDAELLSLDGKTIIITEDLMSAYIADFETETKRERVVSEFSQVSSILRKKAKDANVDGTIYTSDWVRGVEDGSVETTPKLLKAVTDLLSRVRGENLKADLFS